MAPAVFTHVRRRISISYAMENAANVRENTLTAIKDQHRTSMSLRVHSQFNGGKIPRAVLYLTKEVHPVNGSCEASIWVVESKYYIDVC